MVCFLMEARLDKEGLEKFFRDLLFPNNIVVKQPNSRGGLVSILKEDVRLDLINYIANHILVKVREEDGHNWFLTSFYGQPEASQRGKFWALLNHLKYFVDCPWVCVDDFNAILSSAEKLSRTPPQQRLMDDFREALELPNLMDLGFKGFQYTWNNRRPGAANTKQRLDQAVSNEAWRDKFPLSIVTHLSSHASDHIPTILQTQCARQWRAKGSHGFKFEESWLLWDDCKAMIKDAWEKGNNEVIALAAAKQKIEACGADLLAQGLSKTHLETKEIKRIQKKIKDLNCADYTKGIKAEFLETSKNLDELLHRQEIYWVQRFRIHWLKHGDKNTKFFHSKASQRRKRNYIQRLKDTKNN